MSLDLTCGGLLNVHPFVSERKVMALTEMVKFAKMGGYAGQRARTDLAETLSTSDAPFSYAHLVNLRNLPLYQEETPDYDAITTIEDVPDFNPATFSALRSNWAGLEHGKDNDGERIAPKVAELDTYQYAFGYTQESTDIAVEKRGFKVGWSLERGVNDPFGLITRFPADMLRVGRKTDEYVVIRALLNGVTGASELDGGDVDFISGETVPADSPATPAALRVAIRQIGQRTDSQGNRFPIPARFRLVVAQGAAESIQWSLGLARGLYSIDDGSITYRAASTPADPLGRIAGVIESEFVTGNAWYLVPEDGTTDRPALIRVRLTGYTSPEVYVSNFNGAPVLGGASSNPFQAYSFDNDSIDLKFRQFTNAGLFSEDAIVWSDGTYEPTP
jgi:hypothetical protein